MSINETDLDNHITGHWGEDQLADVDDLYEGQFEDEEQRYAQARRVGILELMDELVLRDERIANLEKAVAILLTTGGDKQQARRLLPQYFSDDD